MLAYSSNMSEIITDYADHFDCEWYRDTYYGSVCVEGALGKVVKFDLDNYHAIFQSGKVKGKRLLDIGTGPCVHTIMSACRHVDDIYLSDYTAQNRKALTDWWKSDKTMLENITEYILRMENSGETVAERQKTMKGKVRAVLPIDVTQTKPLGTGCDVTEFDIITSSLCLEAASRTLELYRRHAGNVTPLLKKGGHFILNGTLGESWYRVGDKKFASLNLTKEDIESTYVSCGFDVISLKHGASSEGGNFSDYHGYFVMHAIKK
ncbi:phenylethanolamine N-methyltransferase-like [Argopecten irradians]|uniref:phenylethanolamine N-methyltransferase-like n=1 Tax=Argopecten irradians TaxID=31199 RepID=UPI00371329B0